MAVTTTTTTINSIYLLSLLLVFSLLLTQTKSQVSPPAPPTSKPNSTLPLAPAPAPSSDLCNGIFITYQYLSGKKIHPFRPGKTQPFSFKSTLTLLNNDDVAIKSWRTFVGFQHNELLVTADGAVLANGSSLPGLVGNGTILAGYPTADIKTLIQTAGDSKAATVKINLAGTQFGVAAPDIPLPNNISLANDGYICDTPFKIGAGHRSSPNK